VRGASDRGEFWQAVLRAGDVRSREPMHPALKLWRGDAGEAKHGQKHTGRNEWEGEFSKTAMAEGTGATGGFLVPDEFRAELMNVTVPLVNVRQRATIIPMRRRTILIPVVKQTGTTANQPHWFGGMVASWVEEAASKSESEPEFQQVELTAHKLVCYSRASDELLEDGAISFDAFLRGPMGFAGAIAWQEEWAFINGTGAGQPLGVLNSGACISVARAADSGVTVPDLTNMLEHFYGQIPVWMISRTQMSELMQLNGPSGNASYVFMPNARDGMPATLLGYPIAWSEMMPAKNTAGDVALIDWSYYLVGDRQMTTVDSTTLERFRYDQTSWRAVHRVDGQPWLTSYLTLADGSSTVSPFVKLGAKSS